MKLYVLALALLLAGCGGTMPTTPAVPQIIVKTKIVPITIPDEMFEKPAQLPYQDPAKMSDEDLAGWLIDNEKRNVTIELKLDAIKAYQERRLKDLEPVLKAQ